MGIKIVPEKGDGGAEVGGARWIDAADRGRVVACISRVKGRGRGTGGKIVELQIDQYPELRDSGGAPKPNRVFPAVTEQLRVG